MERQEPPARARRDAAPAQRKPPREERRQEQQLIMQPQMDEQRQERGHDPSMLRQRDALVARDFFAGRLEDRNTSIWGCELRGSERPETIPLAVASLELGSPPIFRSSCENHVLQGGALLASGA